MKARRALSVPDLLALSSLSRKTCLRRTFGDCGICSTGRGDRHGSSRSRTHFTSGKTTKQRSYHLFNALSSSERTRTWLDGKMCVQSCELVELTRWGHQALDSTWKTIPTRWAARSKSSCTTRPANRSSDERISEEKFNFNELLRLRLNQSTTIDNKCE